MWRAALSSSRSRGAGLVPRQRIGRPLHLSLRSGARRRERALDRPSADLAQPSVAKQRARRSAPAMSAPSGILVCRNELTASMASAFVVSTDRRLHLPSRVPRAEADRRDRRCVSWRRRRGAADDARTDRLQREGYRSCASGTYDVLAISMGSMPRSSASSICEPPLPRSPTRRERADLARSR